MLTPKEIKKLYEQGKNISSILREEKGILQNTEEIIEISYELQTGSYIAAFEDTEMAKYIEEYTEEIAKTITSLCDLTSILEAGVGEGTTLVGVLKKLIPQSIKSYGFDLSWSRVAYARQWLKKQGISDATLCTGSLFHIPLADNSVDVVYTSHSIESNAGNEKRIIEELYRVTRKYLILLEPGYELATDEAKKRMESHGYCKNLKGTSELLGYEVIEHKLFPFTSNPLNPTAIIIIKKETSASRPNYILACPRFKTPLQKIGGMLFSPEALVVYPVLYDIPCLRIENGIMASKYREIVGTS